MSLTDIIYTIIIRPLELIFELIYSLSYQAVPNAAVNLIVMSIVFNLIVLPLYRRADVIQLEARKREEEISPVTDYIKRVFKGDERVMMLQAYYRISGYSPLSSLKSIVSLLLQVPFFIAAYRFLSQLTLLNGQSMGPIKDLSRPDGLLVIGGLTVNLLPFIMTIINIISSEVFAKGQPFKNKIVMYLSALIFLVLLYNSPSGLVFYWTMNNVFSLVKNIVFRILPERSHRKKESNTEEKGRYSFLFWMSASYLAVITGLLIPSSTVSSSPLDYLFVNNIVSPSQYVWYTLAVSAGIFVVWAGVYYLLGTGTVRNVFSILMFALAGCASFNYFVFGSGMGTITTEFVFDFDITNDTGLTALMTVSSVIILIVFAGLSKYLRKVSGYIIAAGLLAILGMSVMNIIKTENVCASAADIEDHTTEASFTLSREGKNVVVIMLDRAIGLYVPYIMNEVDGLEESFDGFVYYPNTLSYGDHTNFGAPALFGGYEYTPEKLNARSSEPLKDKHNESLLVMPLIFRNEGYDVSVIDPPYANYVEIMDTSIYDEYDINSFNAELVLNPYYDEMNSFLDETRFHNFFFYSLLKISPALLQPVIYEGGNYNHLSNNGITTEEGELHFPQHYESATVTHGIDPDYYGAYLTLDNISKLTVFTDDEVGSFMMMDNISTHSPNVLQTPGYEVNDDVDNTSYESEHAGRALDDGSSIRLDAYVQMAHYHANVAALKQLGRWFDYLKANDVWDNTRIIVVSDHGRSLFQDNRLIFDDLMFDAEAVNPVLMVKDFDSTGFTTSDEFMTNADVPTIAMNGIVDDPVNPFTGNKINSDAKADDQHILMSEIWRVQENNGNTFLPGSWYSVHDNIFDRSNWEYLGDY